MGAWIEIFWWRGNQLATKKTTKKSDSKPKTSKKTTKKNPISDVDNSKSPITIHDLTQTEPLDTQPLIQETTSTSNQSSTSSSTPSISDRQCDCDRQSIFISYLETENSALKNQVDVLQAEMKQMKQIEKQTKKTQTKLQTWVLCVNQTETFSAMQ